MQFKNSTSHNIDSLAFSISMKFRNNFAPSLQQMYQKIYSDNYVFKEFTYRHPSFVKYITKSSITLSDSVKKGKRVKIVMIG